MNLEQRKQQWIGKGSVVLTLGSEANRALIVVEQRIDGLYNVTRFFAIGKEWEASCDLRAGPASEVFATIERVKGCL